MSRTKKMTLGLSAAALALGAGIGVAGMASATTTPAPAPSASSSASADGSTSTMPGGGMGKHGGRGGERGIAQASALAEKLGVEEAKVTEALQAFREANKPAGPPAEGEKPDAATREAALAKSLAESLGIEESKVTAALEELRSETAGREGGGAENPAGPGRRGREADPGRGGCRHQGGGERRDRRRRH